MAGETPIERVESGRYGHVIAVKLDRMFRSTTDAIETIDHFHANGVAVHFIDFNGQALDTSNPTEVLPHHGRASWRWREAHRRAHQGGHGHPEEPPEVHEGDLRPGREQRGGAGPTGRSRTGST